MCSIRPRSAGCPAYLTVSLWLTGRLPHCVEIKLSGVISEITFGNFQLSCTLIVPGLKASGGCKEHFQRAGCGVVGVVKLGVERREIERKGFCD